jgi:transposase
MRIIGLDIHRAFAEAVAWDDGKLKRLGRVDMRRHPLEAFAEKLTKEEVVVIEATGDAASVAAAITPYVKKVVIANPKQVRVIAHAKIKTDTIDAGVLAQLYASGFLPEVWVPDEPTQALRRQVTRRNQIVRQRSRLKTIIQSILHSRLIPSCPHADLCGEAGRFDQSQKLVSCLGLNPSVRQSGPGPAYHGRITTQGRGHARGMLVEAAWAAARALV